MAQTEEITGKAPREGQAGRRGGWPAVAAVAGATFTVVTSEMLPVGLLTPIGDALHVSEGTAGLTLTITGLVGALSAPLLTPLLGRLDRRVLLCSMMALLTLGNLLAAWAPNFGVMVIARVLVGVGMGVVWAVAAGLAVRLVSVPRPPHSSSAGSRWPRYWAFRPVRTSANWPTGKRRSSSSPPSPWWS
jgi:predicted MFS family arabinose efflux permease